MTIDSSLCAVHRCRVCSFVGRLKKEALQIFVECTKTDLSLNNWVTRAKILSCTYLRHIFADDLSRFVINQHQEHQRGRQWQWHCCQEQTGQAGRAKAQAGSQQEAKGLAMDQMSSRK